MCVCVQMIISSVVGFLALSRGLYLYSLLRLRRSQRLRQLWNDSFSSSAGSPDGDETDVSGVVVVDAEMLESLIGEHPLPMDAR